MSTSQPSHEIYSIDVPEVKDLGADFVYNYFVADEGMNDSGALSKNVKYKNSENRNAEYTQYATTRIPRYVKLTWSTVKLIGKTTSSEKSVRELQNKTSIPRGIIANNIDKIVTEDLFSSNGFVGISFSENRVGEKVTQFISRCTKLANLINTTTSDTAPDLVKKALAQLQDTAGLKRFDDDGKPLKDPSLVEMTNVSINAQINPRLINDIVRKSMLNPYASGAASMLALRDIAAQAHQDALVKGNASFNEDDYKTYVSYIDAKRYAPSAMPIAPASIIGYVIYRQELVGHGNVIDLDPIVIENPHVGSTLDLRVKYGSTYKYTINTISKITLQAVDESTGDIMLLDVLVASRPSPSVLVDCTESVAPPCPADISFTWDYEADKLMIHWAFPPNSQRDIKHFQVFRRSTINEPFELIRQFSFNDAKVQTSKTIHHRESPSSRLVDYLKSPKTFYWDDDFLRSSRAIYTVCSVDAHGATSNYGAQFEIRFDAIKNQIEKRLISHSGAPKPYPNMYLESDTFVDTINVNGSKNSRLRVYFNPEFYWIQNNAKSKNPAFQVKQSNGGYKLQLINLDNLKSELVTISIDDIPSLFSKK